MRNLLSPMVIVLLLFLSNCSTQSDYQDYLKKVVASDLIEHLPHEIDLEEFRIAFNMAPENGDVIAEPVFVYIHFKSRNIDSLRNYVKTNSIAKYLYSDECNIVVHRFQENVSKRSAYSREWIYEDWVKDISDCSVNKYPIPNFIDAGDDRHSAGLSDEYELFVVDAKKGKHFDDKFYSTPLIMPNGWEHGYSKGWALRERDSSAIFWMTIW